MTMDPRITPKQQAEERALRFALLADTAVLTLMVPVGILGGSLTLKAEAIRFVLMLLIEYFAYAVMWRVHRGALLDMEFGGGKLEQIANLVTGIGMLGGAVWIATKAFAIVGGHTAVGTPLGLALAAIVGVLNAYINLLAWDGMRRAARGGTTVVMQGQLKSRGVKLVSSLVVVVTMTRRRSVDGRRGCCLGRCGRVDVRRYLHLLEWNRHAQSRHPGSSRPFRGQGSSRHGRPSAGWQRQRL